MAITDVPAPLRRAPTSVVSDALDDHVPDGDRVPSASGRAPTGDDGDGPNVGGGVLAGRRPAHPDHRAVGRARPIAFERVDGGGRTNFPYAMLDALAAGEVFVLDGVDGVSCWGGMASRLAAEAGLAGVVVARGGFRDVPEVREGSFPVFGAEQTPKTGQYRVEVASTDAPVTVDGVTVTPDDVVVADATGVVVVPGAVEDDVAATAVALLEAEADLEAAIDGGATIADLRADDREF